MATDMNVLKVSAQAYGSSAWRRLVWLVPLTVLAPALVFVLMRDRATDMAKVAPFLSLPGVTVMLFLFAGLRRREILIAVQGRFVRITGWRRSACEGNVTHLAVRPWIMPGLGVAEGAVADLHLDNGIRFSIGAWGYAAPANAPHSTRTADCFVDASTLASLLAAMGAQEASGKPQAREAQFTLVKYGGFASALGGMKWWFGTMAFLGVFGALAGERLMQQPWGMPVVGAVSFLAIGLGLSQTVIASRREKPKYTFAIAKGAAFLRDATGASVWQAGQGSFTIAHEVYVYRTKYGSHRIPILVVAGPQSSLRLGAWNPQPQWQSSQAIAGPAPQYLVASPDWESLLSVLRMGC